MVNPGVLEKPAENTDDADPFGEARDAWPQGADPPHHEVHIDARLRGDIERLNDGRVGETVELGANVAGPAGARVASRPISASRRSSRLLGATRRWRSRACGAWLDPVSSLKSACTSAVMRGSAVKRPTSVYARA